MNLNGLSDAEREIVALLSSYRCLMWLVTREEERALQSLTQVGERKGCAVVSWDLADQWQTHGGVVAELRPGDAGAVLNQIERCNEPALFILKDYHVALQSREQGAGLVRKLRNLSRKLGVKQQLIVILTHTAELPPELRDDCHLVDFPLPTARELRVDLDSFLTQIKESPTDSRSAIPEKLARAAAGLTLNEARVAFAKARFLQLQSRRDPPPLGSNEEAVPLVLEEKARTIRASGALEFQSSRVTMSSVGGLWALRDWLSKRERAFGATARDYRLTRPRGVLVFGIPGTGKSLVCKAVAALWRWPLVRLDVGAVFGSLVGQSEENMRQVIRIVEAVAPCVLWVDEVEKAFGQASGHAVHASVFGAFLTWMQEKRGDVFVVATANEVEALPMEFSRKGRFDEVFFVDLPNDAEREEILRIHLAARRPIITEFELSLPALVEATKDYTGAEIEAALDEAMYDAFYDGEREFTAADILGAVSRIKALAASRPEEVERLRSWVKEGKARSASEMPAEVAKPMTGRFGRAGGGQT
jgi:SpoVK/Ycf46/Vps4 family AAA+-type ATPase